MPGAFEEFDVEAPPADCARRPPRPLRPARSAVGYFLVGLILVAAGVLVAPNPATNQYGIADHLDTPPQLLWEVPLQSSHPSAGRVWIGSDEVVGDLVARYRERYADVGFSENVMYPGVADALAGLHADGQVMAVCTSKRRDFALRILDLFGLARYFVEVDGGDVGIEKWQQLAAMREDGRLPERSLMIGDRAVDLQAAHRNAVNGGAVTWGYGSRGELSTETPEHWFDTPDDWLALVNPHEDTDLDGLVADGRVDVPGERRLLESFLGAVADAVAAEAAGGRRARGWMSAASSMRGRSWTTIGTHATRDSCAMSTASPRRSASTRSAVTSSPSTSSGPRATGIASGWCGSKRTAACSTARRPR